MQRAVESLDLPRYLTRNRGQVMRVKTIGLVDRQVPMPSHLEEIDKSKENLPVLLDIIGVELPDGSRFFARGKVLAILGPSALEPIKSGKRMLLMESNMCLVNGYEDYVALTSIFPNRYTRTPYLYATKVLAKDGSVIGRTYPEFMEVAMKLYKSNWNPEVGFSGIEFKQGYRDACATVNFPYIRDEDKFVYRSKEEITRDEQEKLFLQEPTRQFEYAANSQVGNKTVSSKGRERKEQEGRVNALEAPKYLEELFEATALAESRVNKHLNALQEYSELGLDDLEEAISYTAEQVNKYWRKAISSGCATGRAIFKEVLERTLPDCRDTKKGSTSIDDALNSITKDILTVWEKGDVGTHEGDKLFESVVMERKVLYFQFIDYMLGLRGKLSESANYAMSNLDIDFYSVMKTNPYYLTLIDNRLSVEELDRLAMLYNVDQQSKSVQAFRNAAYLHNLMLDSNNPFIKENTVILKSKLSQIFSNGNILTKRAYGYLQEYGTILQSPTILDLQCYIKKDLKKSDFSLPLDGWSMQKIRGAEKYIRVIEGEDKEQAIQDYIDSGMGLIKEYNGRQYVMDFDYAYKEEYIITRLYELLNQNQEEEVDSALIDRCIRGFERQKCLEYNIEDFKLEDRQGDAVRLLHNAVMCLTGPAGSGKTTTAEALVFALQALLDVDENDIMFCAPTGKAANRLKEVVKKPTRTINSLFLVGGENYSLLKQKNVKPNEKIKVLIVDESSMINLNLMFDMISRIADGTRVIFLGDIEQLPPIGPGKPFSNLLKIFPCVVLNVSKRASDKSGITRNAKTIIYESDTEPIAPLVQTDDFRLLATEMRNIVKLVKGICLYHLGKSTSKATSRAIKTLGTDLEPDSIQVVTPINKYEWGTKMLNKELQNIFNPRHGMCITVSRDRDEEWVINPTTGKYEKQKCYTEFRRGDRVIHLKNNTQAIRLVKDGSVFRQEGTTGIMNGDVGKVEGYYTASQLSFIENEEDEDAVNLEEEFSGNPNTLFMAVSYTDIDENGATLEFLILYRTEKLGLDNEEKTDVVEVTSTELNNLDLAYALTVHKLQGSQADLIIGIMYNVGGGDFLSRNLLYTMVTRAKYGVYLLGDVQGYDNCIDRARRIEQVGNRTSIMDKVYE